MKLLDFWLALERRRADTELEREARVVGTAAYLAAPEHVEHLVVSPAMDVYACSASSRTELVTGNPPFGGTPNLLSRLRRAVMPRASSVNALVPAELDDIIARRCSRPIRSPGRARSTSPSA